MTDVVEIARKRRTLLQSEIAQLDRFLRMAAALQKYEHGGYDGRGRTPIRETVSAPSAAPVSPEPRILPSVPAAQPSAPVAQSSAPVEPAPLQASAVPQVPKKETPPAQTETAQTDTARTEAMQAEVMAGRSQI